MEILKFNGLKNTVADERLRPGDLSTASDVDVDGVGAIRSRHGFTQLSATATHSIWSDGATIYAAQGTALRRMTAAGTFTTIDTLTSSDPISYAKAGGVVYWTNGVDTGRIVGGAGKRWGLRPPPSQPTATTTVGEMPRGTYLYAVTYLRSDGLESGTPAPARFELTASEAGLALTSFPTSSDPDVVGWVLYVSGPNGTDLFRAAVIPLGTTTYYHRAQPRQLGIPLDPGYVEQAPPGTQLAVHAGTMYVVDGSVVWASEVHAMERFQRATRFLQFPGPVNVFAPVADGIYVATDTRTWFLRGTELGALKFEEALTCGAVPGTAATLDSAELDEDDDNGQAPPSSPAAIWLSTDGVVVGRTGGQVQKLTMDAYGIPVGLRGAAIVRAARGYVSYLASVAGSAASGNQH